MDAAKVSGTTAGTYTQQTRQTQTVRDTSSTREGKTLAEMMDELGHSDYFIKIDRSYVVNVLHIMSLKNQQILLRDGSTLPVSKPRLVQVRNEILEYWR